MPAQAFGTPFQLDRIDKDAAVIKGVSVVTAGTANGGVMDMTALKQIMECCQQYSNGLKVVDRHTKGTDSIFATAGILKNFRISGSKLLADMYLLKSEPNAPKLLEMAEKMPDTFGLSVAFSGVDEIISGETHWRCSEIYNAALVDVPAANPTGLFSKNVQELPVHFVDATKEKSLSTMSDTKIAELETKLVELTKAIGAEGTKISDSTGATISPSMTERVKKLEAMISDMEKKFAALPAKGDTTDADADCMAELVTQVKTLSANVDTKLKEFASNRDAENAKIIQGVAKEFSTAIGNVKIAANPTDTTQKNAEEKAGSAKAFTALVAKKFAECKSKVTALKLAMGEDEKGYAAFRDSGLIIKYT